MLSGTGYPSGENYPAGTGMELFFYPHAGTGNPTGKICGCGYGYGWALPVGYVPVAILSREQNNVGILSVPWAMFESFKPKVPWAALSLGYGP
jgi:hypothetical protein